jgi:glycosyltransferase involved in cell wall biosynthesis
VNLLPLAALAATRWRVRTLLVAHGIEAWRPTGRLLVDRAVARVDFFLTVSEYTGARLTDWARLDRSRGFVVPNCVDIARFTPGPKRADLIDRYGLRGRRVLLTLSRLSSLERYKGVDETLEALPKLALRFPQLSYLIVGEGDDRPRLEQKADRLGVRERVVFAGYVPEAEKVDHYRLADAFAMPSRGEGFGIVLIEAMACGIPVVASCLDASREAVRDSEIAVLVDPRDPRDLEAGIAQALSMSAGVRPAVIESFSAECFDGRVRDVIDAVFSRTSPRSPAARVR